MGLLSLLEHQALGNSYLFYIPMFSLHVSNWVHTDGTEYLDGKTSVRKEGKEESVHAGEVHFENIVVMYTYDLK